MKNTTKKPAFVLLSQADTGKLIDGIKTRGAKLDADIQTAAVCSAIHAHQHSDASLLIRLVQALPKGSRSNALKDWMLRYAPIAFDKDGEIVFSRPYDNKDEESRTAAVAACEAATHWTEHKPEPKFVPFDLGAALAALLKKAEAAAKDTEHADAHKIDPEVLGKLKALAE